MKVYTVADIQALKPCSNHDPLIYVDITWSGTVIDILKCTQVSAVNRLWVVYRLLDDKTLRLFAVACARHALASVVNPDIRSIEACNIAAKYANGEATKDELMAATYAAYAVYNASTAAAYDTSTAAYAARAATAAAAAAADRAAAGRAAYAAYAAAAAAATTAAYAAYAAATAYDAAAEHAERQWQVECLINMLK